jgi:hypothetical protein
MSSLTTRRIFLTIHSLPRDPYEPYGEGEGDGKDGE